MTTTDKLADALRCVSAALASAGDMETLSSAIGGRVTEALAAYDAQQAPTPTPGTLSDTGKQTLETLFRELQIGTIFRPDDVRHAFAHAQMCVNAHDGLVAALQACQRVLDDNGGTTPQQWIDAEAAARDALSAAGVRHA